MILNEKTKVEKSTQRREIERESKRLGNVELKASWD